MKRQNVRFWALLSLTLTLLLAAQTAVAAEAEDAVPLSQIDAAVAAALTNYAVRIGEPLVSLEPVTEPERATGAQAVQTLALTDAANPAASLEALRYLPELQTLTVTGGTLKSLTGLENHPSLQTLTLRDCPALDLTPLASCPRLSSLTLIWSDGFTGKGAYDLTPLAGCARLSALTLSGHCVLTLAPVAEMDKLQSFSATGLAVADYAPVGTRANLINIRLYGVTGAQVESAFAGLGKKLATAYLGDCDLTPKANAAILRCTRLKNIGFDNVRGVDATAESWARIISLGCLQMKGGTLAGLGFLSGYTDTVGVKLTDVAVGAEGTVCTVDFDKYFLKLDNVPSAETVKLLSGQKRLWNYATLRMTRGEISAEAIAAFGSIKGLLSLDVQAVAPEAFTSAAWSGFESLQQLKLLNCRDVALQPLAGLPALTRLMLTGCALRGEAAVAQMRKLSVLSFAGCSVRDWAFLDALTCTRPLTTLSIAGCDGPESLAFAKRLPNLTCLAVEDAPVADLTPLAGLAALEKLSVFGCPVTDATPLVGLQRLRWLSLNEGVRTPGYNGRVEHRRLVAVP